MSVADSNTSNNNPGTLNRVSGLILTDNTNYQYNWSMMKSVKDYYIISQSSANIILFNDVKLSDCAYSFPKKNMYVTNITTDFTLSFDKPTVLYDDKGIRLLPASSYFSTQQRILTESDFSNVQIKDKSLTVYSFSELNKSNLTGFLVNVNGTVRKSIDPTTTDNEYKLIRAETKNNSTDYTDRVFINNEDLTDDNVDYILWRWAQLSMGMETLKKPAYKQSYPIETFSLEEQLEFYNNVKKIDKVNKAETYTTLDHDKFFFITQDEIIKYIRNVFAKEEDKIKDPVWNVTLSESYGAARFECAYDSNIFFDLIKCSTMTDIDGYI